MLGEQMKIIWPVNFRFYILMSKYRDWIITAFVSVFVALLASVLNKFKRRKCILFVVANGHTPSPHIIVGKP